MEALVAQAGSEVRPIRTNEGLPEYGRGGEDDEGNRLDLCCLLGGGVVECFRLLLVRVVDAVRVASLSVLRCANIDGVLAGCVVMRERMRGEESMSVSCRASSPNLSQTDQVRSG